MQVSLEQVRRSNEMVANLALKHRQGAHRPVQLPSTYTPEPGCPFGSPTRLLLPAHRPRVLRAGVECVNVLNIHMCSNRGDKFLEDLIEVGTRL